MGNSDIARASFDAYRSQDRARADELFSPELTFTSPQDDHIGKAEYLARCFPTADRFRSQDLLHVAEVDHRTVFLVYEYQLATGGTHRNAELITVEDGRITEVQVFFGGRYDGAPSR